MLHKSESEEKAESMAHKEPTPTEGTPEEDKMVSNTDDTESKITRDEDNTVNTDKRVTEKDASAEEETTETDTKGQNESPPMMSIMTKPHPNWTKAVKECAQNKYLTMPMLLDGGAQLDQIEEQHAVGLEHRDVKNPGIIQTSRGKAAYNREAFVPGLGWMAVVPDGLGNFLNPIQFDKMGAAGKYNTQKGIYEIYYRGQLLLKATVIEEGADALPNYRLIWTNPRITAVKQPHQMTQATERPVRRMSYAEIHRVLMHTSRDKIYNMVRHTNLLDGIDIIGGIPDKETCLECLEHKTSAPSRANSGFPDTVKHYHEIGKLACDQHELADGRVSFVAHDVGSGMTFHTLCPSTKAADVVAAFDEFKAHYSRAGNKLREITTDQHASFMSTSVRVWARENDVEIVPSGAHDKNMSVAEQPYRSFCDKIRATLETMDLSERAWPRIADVLAGIKNATPSTTNPGGASPDDMFGTPHERRMPLSKIYEMGQVMAITIHRESKADKRADIGFYIGRNTRVRGGVWLLTRDGRINTYTRVKPTKLTVLEYATLDMDKAAEAHNELVDNYDNSIDDEPAGEAEKEIEITENTGDHVDSDTPNPSATEQAEAEIDPNKNDNEMSEHEDKVTKMLEEDGNIIKQTFSNWDGADKQKPALMEQMAKKLGGANQRQLREMRKLMELIPNHGKAKDSQIETANIDMNRRVLRSRKAQAGQDLQQPLNNEHTEIISNLKQLLQIDEEDNGNTLYAMEIEGTDATRNILCNNKTEVYGYLEDLDDDSNDLPAAEYDNHCDRLPRNEREARAFPFVRFFRRALQAERDVFRHHRVFEEIFYEDIPETAIKVGTTGVYTLKRNPATGECIKAKARMALRGDRIGEGWTGHTESQTNMPEATQTGMILTIAVTHPGYDGPMWTVYTTDSRGAYLQSERSSDDPVIVDPFLDVVQIEKADSKYLLKKNMYGMASAGRDFEIHRHRILTQVLKAEVSPRCPSLYTWGQYGTNEYCMALFFVDDSLWTGPDACFVKSKIEEYNQLVEGDDPYPVERWLGMAVETDDEMQTISLHAPTKITEIVELAGVKPKQFSDTPGYADKDLRPHDPEAEDPQHQLLPKSDKKLYQRLIGKIAYIARFYRFDLLQAIGELQKFTANPTLEHMIALQKLVRYLNKTQAYRKVYYKGTPADQEPLIQTTSDASHGDNKFDRYSRTGYAIALAGNVILAVSRKQKSVAISSMESETIAASEAVRDTIHVQSQLFTSTGLSGRPARVLMDNMSVVQVAGKPHYTRGAKHVAVRMASIQDAQAKGLVKVQHVPSADNGSDLLTKQLPIKVFEQHRKYLGVMAPNEAQV